MEFIYTELRRQGKLDSYQISFDVNFGAIKRTVMYNSNIFALDMYGENIYLREKQSIFVLADRYKVDDTIQGIIRTFVRAA